MTETLRERAAGERMTASLESDAVIVKLSTEVIVTKYGALAACVVVGILAGIVVRMLRV